MAINPSFRMHLQNFPNNRVLYQKVKFVCFGIQETRFELIFSIADRDTIVWSWLLTFLRVPKERAFLRGSFEIPHIKLK